MRALSRSLPLPPSSPPLTSHRRPAPTYTRARAHAATLQRMLPAYLRHLRANPDTLIVKFFGCMSLRLYEKALFFVVMENMLPRAAAATVHQRFDLKGSWVGRR